MTQFSSLWQRLLTQELGTDDSTQLFTDARRQAGINDGIAEFADLTECFIRVSTQTWTGGTREIDLNSTAVLPDGDFLRLAAKQSPVVIYTDASSQTQTFSGDDLRQVDVAWLNRHEPDWQHSTVASSVAQTPSRFYLRPDGGSLWFGLDPVPSTGSSASITVQIPYVAKPAILQSTDATVEPYAISGVTRTDLRIFHKAAVHFGAHQLEKLRRDDEASDRQLQRFLSYVTRYLQTMRQKGGTSLTFTRSYFRRSLGGDDRPRDPRT
jgi:hypothetical protein